MVKETAHTVRATVKQTQEVDDADAEGNDQPPPTSVPGSLQPQQATDSRAASNLVFASLNSETDVDAMVLQSRESETDVDAMVLQTKDTDTDGEVHAPVSSLEPSPNKLGQSNSLRATGLSDPNIASSAVNPPSKSNSMDNMDNLETQLDDASLKRTAAEWNLLQVTASPSPPSTDPVARSTSSTTDDNDALDELMANLAHLSVTGEDYATLLTNTAQDDSDYLEVGASPTPPTSDPDSDASSVSLASTSRTETANRTSFTGPSVDLRRIIDEHTTDANAHAAQRSMQQHASALCNPPGHVSTTNEIDSQFPAQAIHPFPKLSSEDPPVPALVGVPYVVGAAPETHLAEQGSHQEAGGDAGPPLPVRRYTPDGITAIIKDTASSHAVSSAVAIRDNAKIATNTSSSQDENSSPTPRTAGDAEALAQGTNQGTGKNIPDQAREMPEYWSMTGNSLIQGTTNQQHGYARIQGASDSSGDGSAGRVPAGLLLRNGSSTSEDHYSTIGSSVLQPNRHLATTTRSSQANHADQPAIARSSNAMPADLAAAIASLERAPLQPMQPHVARTQELPEAQGAQGTQEAPTAPGNVRPSHFARADTDLLALAARSSTLAPILAFNQTHRHQSTRSSRVICHPHPLQDQSHSRVQWRCDGCDGEDIRAPSLPGTRFRCAMGCDYDLCIRCMMASVRPGHPSIQTAGDDATAAGSSSQTNPPPSVAEHSDTTPGSLHFFEDETGQRHYYQFGREGSLPEAAPALRQAAPTRTMEPRLQLADGPRGRHVVNGPADVSPGGRAGVVAGPLSTQLSARDGRRRTISARTRRDGAQFLHAHSVPLPASPARGGRTLSQLPSLTPNDLRRFLADLREQDIPTTAEERNELIERIVTRVLQQSEEEARVLQESEAPPKMEYTLTIFRRKFKILMNRATLITVLDRNKYPNVEAPLAVLLAVATTICGFELVAFYSGVGTVLLWFVVASAQYSLLKSVQSDPGSSLLGERGLGFTRAVYLILLTAIVFSIDAAGLEGRQKIFQMEYSGMNASNAIRDFFLIVILALPLVWLFGHLPMWARTLFHHLFEQVDISLCGGGGSISAVGALVRFLGFGVCFATCTGVCYAALGNDDGRTDNVTFSIFIGVTAALGYLLSRLPSDPKLLLRAIRGSAIPAPYTTDEHHILRQAALMRRLAWDVCLMVLIGVIAAILHWSGLFGVTSSGFETLVQTFAVVLGSLLNYVIPEMQKTYPLRLFHSPLLSRHTARSATPTSEKQSASGMPESNMLQKNLRRLGFFEGYIVWPMVVLSVATQYGQQTRVKFGRLGGSMVLSLASIKLIRLGYSDRTLLWASLTFALLFFQYDFDISEGVLVDFFVSTIIVEKLCGLFMRLSFAYAYCAPWNMKNVLGSSFHAISLPLQIPHAAMLLVQAMVATFIAAPIYPVMGSHFFLVSYFRPLKFFERHYATKPMDYGERTKDPSTARSKHVANATANNLNSVFYHHLLRQLEIQLCSSIEEGKFGTVQAGDVFLLTDMEDGEGNNMTAFMHIIDRGNGFVSFQLRGLEFVGTFCQLKEQEALRHSHRQDRGALSQRFECCHKKCSKLLPVSTAMKLRWQTWASINDCYTVPGYSISINAAESMFQSFDQQKLLITRLSQAVIYYVVAHPDLLKWMSVSKVREKLDAVNFTSTEKHRHMNGRLDADYDSARGGISLGSFAAKYFEWMTYCNQHRDIPVTAAVLREAYGDEDSDDDSVISSMSDDVDAEDTKALVRLCFLLTTFARMKFLSKCKRQPASRSPTRCEIFLHGYHAVFGGDFSPSTPGDAWIFQQENLIISSVLPGVRMALKLHQDEYIVMGEYDEDPEALFDAICEYDSGSALGVTVRAETDPAWTEAVLASEPSLVSLRWNNEDSSNNRQFFVPVITKHKRDFKVFKINRECVRGLWASQQQELLFFQNTYAERGSIQNSTVVLRNMISQSCDEPVGYPIFVSELTHSFAGGASHSPWQIVLNCAKWVGACVSSHVRPRRSSSGVPGASSPPSNGETNKGGIEMADLSTSGVSIDGHLLVEGQDVETITSLSNNDYLEMSSTDNNWDEEDAVAINAVLETSMRMGAGTPEDVDDEVHGADMRTVSDGATSSTSDDILPASSS